MAFFLFPASEAFAAEEVDTGATGNITIKSCPVDGQVIRAYRVASMNAAGGLETDQSLSNVLSQTNINLESLLDETTAERSLSAAQTLKGYVSAHAQSISSVQAIVHDGSTTFTGLTPGLYLIVGENISLEGTNYIFAPFLIAIPAKSSEGTYIYTRTVEETKFLTTTSKDYKNSVTKIWSQDNKRSRPSSVTVDIYNGTTLFRTVVLSSENNWFYSWSGKGDWSVVEHLKKSNASYATSTQSTIREVSSVVHTDMVITNAGRHKRTTVSNLPKTGDTTSLMIPITLGATSVLCLFIAISLRSRKDTRS